MATYLHTMATLRTTSERYAIEDALQAAIRESERCENWRSDGVEGESGTICGQRGPLCINEECGLCQSCSAAGYLCPNASEHDFGKV